MGSPRSLFCDRICRLRVISFGFSSAAYDHVRLFSADHIRPCDDKRRSFALYWESLLGFSCTRSKDLAAGREIFTGDGNDICFTVIVLLGWKTSPSYPRTTSAFSASLDTYDRELSSPRRFYLCVANTILIVVY